MTRTHIPNDVEKRLLDGAAIIKTSDERAPFGAFFTFADTGAVRRGSTADRGREAEAARRWSIRGFADLGPHVIGLGSWLSRLWYRAATRDEGKLRDVPEIVRKVEQLKADFETATRIWPRDENAIRRAWTRLFDAKNEQLRQEINSSRDPAPRSSVKLEKGR